LQTEHLEPNGVDPEDKKVFIDETEWLAKEKEISELQGYKKAMEESQIRLGQQHPEISAPPATPKPPPEFPLHSEEELQTALDAGDLRSYHKLTTHNQKQELAKARWEIQTNEIEPLRQAGTQTLSDLSGRFAAQNMDHLDVPDVRKTYEERLNGLKSQGQVITPDIHQSVYEWAVGTNIDKIQEKFQQTFLRTQETEVNTPTGATGRDAGTEADKVPSVESYFEPTALGLLTRKHGAGLSPLDAANKEFARHGGWEEYYKKVLNKKEGE
jgi:hypothetical protein